MPSNKTKSPVVVRRAPQKAIALSPEGRKAWDTLKGLVEDQVGLSLTHEQVIGVLLKRASAK